MGGAVETRRRGSEGAVLERKWMSRIEGFAEAVSGVDFEVSSEMRIVNREIDLRREFARMMRNRQGVPLLEQIPEFRKRDL